MYMINKSKIYNVVNPVIMLTISVGLIKYIYGKERNTMTKLDFSGREKSQRPRSTGIFGNSTPRKRTSDSTGEKKNAMYFTSKIQLILGQKEKAEDEAASLIGEYIVYMTTEEYIDEKRLMKELDNMLRGFDLEEKNRILMKALIRSQIPMN